jgi:hypothetical protein
MRRLQQAIKVSRAGPLLRRGAHSSKNHPPIPTGYTPATTHGFGFNHAMPEMFSAMYGQGLCFW